MTTVVEMITLALKDIGHLGGAETPSPEDLTDSFTTLKQMIAQWQSDGLMVYAQVDVSFSPTGAQSYTVGAGGNVNTTRPTQIIAAFWRDGSSDYPLGVLTSLEEYQSICQKSLGSIPEAVYYNPTYPLGTLYIWPVASSGSIHLTTLQQFSAYTSPTNDLNIPPEYEMAARYSLCELLSATFQLPLRADLAALAKRYRKVVKRNNVHIPELGMPVAAMMNRYFNINEG